MATTALISTCLTTGAIRPAVAQSETVRTYAIPPGGLAGALNRFADTAQIQLVYDASITRDLRSSGLNGSFTPSQGLARLLAGTGLEWRFANASTVTISAPRPESSGEAVPDVPVQDVPVEAGAIQLGAITVSGEKLERDLHNVYTSVGVLTEQQLDDYVVDNVREGLNKLSNTRVSEAGRGNSGIVVRGVSSDGLTQPVNSTPAIAVIVDGASQNGEGIRRGTRGTWDVESMEVLRGPQSALQGRNAMGGAVVLKTFDPSWTWTGAAQGDLAVATEYDGYSGNAAFMLSGPLVENQIAFRFTGEVIDGKEGITYADPLNEELEEDYFSQLRGKLLVTPDQMPGFRALVSVSNTDDKPGVASATGPDFFKREFNFPATSVELRDTGVTNTVADLSQDLGSGMVLRSVSAFIDTEAQIDTPAGSTSFVRDESRTGDDFTQDLRLELAEDARAISGVAGLYYAKFQNKTDSLILVDIGFGPLLFQDLQGRNETTSAAAYADLRYDLGESNWTLLFGGRLGHETVENERNGTVLNTDTFQYDLISEDASTDYLVALPKIGLSYEIDEDHTVAFFMSEGFRAGFTNVDSTGTIYDVAPEYLRAYEVAYRSRWFDDRLEFNANTFYYDFTDLQIDIDDPNTGPPFTVTRNIGAAHAYGAEFDVRARPIETVTVFAGLGLLKTVLDKAVTSEGDFSGTAFPEAPAATFNVGAVYKNDWGFFASADLGYTASYYSVGDIENTRDEKVPDFTVVNAAMGYEAQNLSVTLYAKNIFDEQYVTGISVDNGDEEANVGDGRMIGIRVKAKF